MMAKGLEGLSMDDPKTFDVYVVAAMNTVTSLRLAQGNVSEPDDDFYKQVFDMAERMVFERDKLEKAIAVRKQYEQEWSIERLDLPETK